jgi:hypothetical protein
MLAILHSLGLFVADLFKPRCRLEAENLFLRHQLSIALRRAPPRLRLRGVDRALLVWMTRLWPSLLGAAQVVQPETILRWHRAGFTATRLPISQMKEPRRSGARFIPFSAYSDNPGGFGGIGAVTNAFVDFISHRPWSGCDGHHILSQFAS